MKITRIKAIEKIVSILYRRSRKFLFDCCIESHEPEEIEKALKKIAELNKALFKMLAEFKSDKGNAKFAEYSPYELCTIFVLFGGFYRSEISMSSSTDLAEILLNDVESFIPLINSIKSGRLSKFFKIEKGHRGNSRIDFEPVMEPDALFDFLLK